MRLLVFSFFFGTCALSVRAVVSRMHVRSTPLTGTRSGTVSLNTALELRLEQIAVRCPLEADDEADSASVASVPVTMPARGPSEEDALAELDEALGTSQSEPLVLPQARAGGWLGLHVV